MVEASAKYAVDVLDQGEVSFVQRVFLGLMPTVERDFFAIVDQARVLEAEFAL